MVAATADLCHGRTALIVAHRPAMIELADRVIRLHEGRVIADTTSGPAPGSRRTTAPRTTTEGTADPPMERTRNERTGTQR